MQSNTEIQNKITDDARSYKEQKTLKDTQNTGKQTNKSPCQE